MAERSTTLIIKERCTRLGELNKQRLETQMKDHQTPCPKIQRVAHHLRDRENFRKHYSPKLVSIGPIHHGEKHLQQGEEYKLNWTAMFVGSTKETTQTLEESAQTLYKRIADKIEELKDLFTKDAIQGFNDYEELSWMLFVDGCSLLQIMDKVGHHHPAEELDLKVDQLVLVQQDVFLLENQIPYQVLKLLSSDEAQLIKTMDEFLKCHHLLSDRAPTVTRPGLTNESPEFIVTVQQGSPTHLLDHLRRAILDGCTKKINKVNVKPANPSMSRECIVKVRKVTSFLSDCLRTAILCSYYRKKQDNDETITYRNIQELRAAGVKLKKSESNCLINISFVPGRFTSRLKLPKIMVDDTTAPSFLNLMAYEMCPDFKNDYEICSFVAFLDSIIDNADDVKELRSAKILHNHIGSDEEVAKLFNYISSDLVPDMDIYDQVRKDIEKHYRSKCKTWIYQGYHKYFGNPWSIIGFHAAVFALVLTFIQTWYSVIS